MEHHQTGVATAPVLHLADLAVRGLLLLQWWWCRAICRATKFLGVHTEGCDPDHVREKYSAAGVHADDGSIRSRLLDQLLHLRGCPHRLHTLLPMFYHDSGWAVQPRQLRDYSWISFLLLPLRSTLLLLYLCLLRRAPVGESVHHPVAHRSRTLKLTCLSML